MLFEYLIEYFLAIIDFLVNYWYIWTLASLFFLGCAVVGICVERRNSRSGIDRVDIENAKEFQELLENVLKGMGYRIDSHHHTNDHNLDLIALKDGVKVMVRTIRNKGKVGLKAINDALKLKAIHECHGVIIVTNKSYSGRARDLAARNGVVLWNRDDLATNLIDTGGEVAAEEEETAVSYETGHVKTIDEFMEEQ